MYTCTHTHRHANAKHTLLIDSEAAKCQKRYCWSCAAVVWNSDVLDTTAVPNLAHVYVHVCVHVCFPLHVEQSQTETERKERRRRTQITSKAAEETDIDLH